MDAAYVQSFAVSCTAGVGYGFVVYGTPLFPRKLKWSFLATGPTAAIFFGLIRNSGDPNAIFNRTIPFMTFNLCILLGVQIREVLEEKWYVPSIFSDILEVIHPVTHDATVEVKEVPREDK